MYNFNAKKLAQYLLKVREGRRELAYDISHKINYTGSDIFAEVSNEQLCNKREMINQQLLYTANVYVKLRGDYRGFLQYLQGKPVISAGFSLKSVNIMGFSLQILQKSPVITP